MQPALLTPRRLTPQQRAILADLSLYRFTTTSLLAERLHVARYTMQMRLSLLMRDGYVGRRYGKEYRLQGKPAVYYLRPDGLRALIAEPSKAQLNSTYRDASASVTFIECKLILQQLPSALKQRYPQETVQVHPKRALAAHSYFPRPLPDGYVMLASGASVRRYFLLIVQEHVPSFALRQRLEGLVEYAESGAWDITTKPLPRLLLLAENDRALLVARRACRYLTNELEDSGLGWTATTVRALALDP